MIQKINFQFDEDMKIFAQAIIDNFGVEIVYDENLYAFEFNREEPITELLKECEGINKGRMIYSYLTEEGKAIVYGLEETFMFIGEVDLSDV